MAEAHDPACEYRVEGRPDGPTLVFIHGWPDNASLWRKQALMITAYQWALVIAWLAGGLIPPLGGLLAKGVGKAIGVPARQRAALRSRFGYPYFHL